jgi:hypothetical protein
LPTISADLWETIAAEAARESPLWNDALLPRERRQPLGVFSALAPDRFALGLETIYEGYLVHYGRPRLFDSPDSDTALLLGDYLYAHGLVRIADLGDVEAVRDLAELISLCAHLRAEDLPGDGEAWAETSQRLGRASGSEPLTRSDGGGDGGAAARRRALVAHAERVG